MSAYLAPDAEQIKKAIATLHRAGSVIELRAIQKGGHKRVDAGYFDDECKVHNSTVGNSHWYASVDLARHPATS